MNRFVHGLLLIAVVSASQAQSAVSERDGVVTTFPEREVIKELLEQPEDAIDFGRSKLAIDRLIDPAIDIDASLESLDAIVGTIRRMSREQSTSQERMLLLKKYLYESGEWNDFLPYRYDFDDPLGTKISNKLLPTYLATRRGIRPISHGKRGRSIRRYFGS